jgi:hypothetical protein
MLDSSEWILKLQRLRQKHEGAAEVTLWDIFHLRIESITFEPNSQRCHMHTQLMALTANGTEPIPAPTLVVL